MGELDRIFNLMQAGFAMTNKKLDGLQENQAYHTKDIEYIKKEIDDKKNNNKENKKMWGVIITSGTALVGVIIKWIVG